MKGIHRKSRKNLTKFRRSPLAKTASKATRNTKLAHEFEMITTAFHEAGHALASLLTYGFVHFVVLYPNRKADEDLGAADYDGPAELEDTKDNTLLNYLINADITIYQAGLATEKLFYKEICGQDHLPYVIKEGSHKDFEYVSEIIKKYDLAPPGKKRYAFKKKSFRKTQRLLSNYWEDVKLIAHAVFQKKKLYFSDLKDLLTKKSITKKFWKDQFKTIESLHAEELSESQIKRLIKL